MCKVLKGIEYRWIDNKNTVFEIDVSDISIKNIIRKV